MDEEMLGNPIQPNKTVYLYPTGNHTHTLIYLHGYSLTGHFEKHWFFKYYNVTHPNLKIVCLTAKHRYEPAMYTSYNSWFQYMLVRNSDKEWARV